MIRKDVGIPKIEKICGSIWFGFLGFEGNCKLSRRKDGSTRTLHQQGLPGLSQFSAEPQLRTPTVCNVNFQFFLFQICAS